MTDLKSFSIVDKAKMSKSAIKGEVQELATMMPNGDKIVVKGVFEASSGRFLLPASEGQEQAMQERIRNVIAYKKHNPAVEEPSDELA